MMVMVAAVLFIANNTFAATSKMRPAFADLRASKYTAEDALALINYTFKGAPAPSFKTDLNRDGVTDVLDVTLMIRSLSRVERRRLQALSAPHYTADQVLAAIDYIFKGGEAPDFNVDVNGDGAPDVLDIVLMIRGLSPEERERLASLKSGLTDLKNTIGQDNELSSRRRVMGKKGNAPQTYHPLREGNHQELKSKR